MEAVLEEHSEVGATPNYTEVEERAVAAFKTLENAELEFGMAFGEAIIALRAEVKANGRNWMKRLKQLGITYEKARYWIAMVEGKPTDRHKKVGATPNSEMFDWDAALDRLKQLTDEVELLKKREPLGNSKLFGELEKLADILGYSLIKNGEFNETRVLQREQQTRGGLAQGAHVGGSNSGGSGR